MGILKRNPIKNWWCRNFYNHWKPKQEYCWRRLTEFKAVCDICNKPINFSDYGYMCRKHGDIYYNKTLWKYFPKFMFKIYVKVKGVK